MQKKMIVLAVSALVSGAAFAQTNVTVYGVVDVGYGYSKAGDLKFSGLVSGQLNGSRVGFRGKEDLGNGLSAVFQAEFGFKADQFDSKGTSAGAGVFNNVRNSWVGLQHANYGTLTLGRHNSVANDWTPKGFASDVSVYYPSNTIQESFLTMYSSDRVNNTIKYQSPNLNGFEARAFYGFGEVVGTTAKPGDTSDAARYGIGGAYKNGPIDLALIYQGVAKDDTKPVDGSVNAWFLGGSYDFNVVKVFAAYQIESNKQLGANSDKDLWTLGARVPVGKAGTVVFEYVDYKDDTNNLLENQRAKGWGLGYEHAMSKRTVLYTNVGYISNNETSKQAFGGVGQLDKNNTNFSIGMRHSF